MAKQQNKMVELSILDQQLKQLEQKAIELEKNVYELQLSSLALEDLQGKKGSEVMIPLAGGIFVRGKIEDAEKVIVHVGNKILAKKTLDQAKKIVEKQIDKLSKERLKIDKEMNKMIAKMTSLQSGMHSPSCGCGDEECESCEGEDSCNCGHHH